MKKILMSLILLVGCTGDATPQLTASRCGLMEIEIPAFVYYRHGFIITCPEHSHLTGEKFNATDFESGLVYPDRWRAICECDK